MIERVVIVMMLAVLGMAFLMLCDMIRRELNVRGIKLRKLLRSLRKETKSQDLHNGNTKLHNPEHHQCNLSRRALKEI